MRIHSVKPGQITVGNASQTETTSTKESKQRKSGVAGSPSLKTRSPSSNRSSSAKAPVLSVHSEPRVELRVNTQAVHDALGSKAAMLQEQIDPQRLPGFYKHANMVLSGTAVDKDFLLDCLISLYQSAPDPQHPNATDAEWVDDQDVLWGDELLFLFEVTAQLDRLSSEGKRYFADSLAARIGIERPSSGSLGALEQALLKAGHRMAVADSA